MNKRLLELAEQAGMTDDKYGMFFAKDFDSHCADGVDLEKFAELIIKDCVDIVNTWSDEKPCSEGYDIIPVHRIKEHFGVEE